MARFPARIHVLLASRAALGLVIRRGPAKSVATLLWDRRNDQFQLGQWLKGRLYERRCDLSPDGKHLLYFAMNGKWSSEARGSWSAISRAPYLRALALFPKGDCWHGGGVWTGPKSYWLNDGCGHSVLRDSREFQRDHSYQPPGFGGECPGVYYPRLLRDGWRLEAGPDAGEAVFEKPLHHGWILRKKAHAGVQSGEGRGCYWDEHKLVRPSSGLEIDCPKWEWAELDGGRLVWAEEGKLHAASVEPGGLTEERELFDFNPMVFEPIRAPY